MSTSKQNKDTYIFSVYASYLPFPLIGAVHTYFVVSKNGKRTRYDLISPEHYTNVTPIAGHIYKDILKPEQGFTRYYFKKPVFTNIRWRVRPLHRIEGAENSLAQHMYSFFESGGYESYPLKDVYHMVKGPNSNTFTQWVIDQSPDLQIKLPWNAWGKNFQR